MPPTPQKRGPGRPRGSKNKPTTGAKRGPGRPEGSTNKAKTAPTGKPRGRPKGSKNRKPADSVATGTPDNSEQVLEWLAAEE